jgi:UDP-N-acetylmuramyl tripeptide synthase
MQKELAEKMRRREERAKLLQELREQGESTDGIVIEGLGSHDVHTHSLTTPCAIDISVLFWI